MKHLPCVLVVIIAAVPAMGIAADGKGGRLCPQSLAAYASADGSVLLEFSGAPDLSFRLLVTGRAAAFDGYVFPGEDPAQTEAVILDNCPEGDVTGTELEACTIWRGPVEGRAADDTGTKLPAAQQPAASRLHLASLAAALSDADMAAADFETLTLTACQE